MLFVYIHYIVSAFTIVQAHTRNMMAGIGVLNLSCIQLSTSGIDPSLAATSSSRGDPYMLPMAPPIVDMDTSRGSITSPALPSSDSPNV